MRFAFFVMIWAVASPPTNAEAFVSNGLDGETANKIRVFAMAGAAAGNSPHAHDNPAAITVVRNATVEALSYDPAYYSRHIIGCNSDLSYEISQIANLLCKKHKQSVLFKLNKIKIVAKKNEDIANKQLIALHHRAKTLMESGSCPPANGLFGDKN